MLIDAKWNIRHAACYDIDHLHDLYDHPHTLLEVLTRQDGEWKMVHTSDRLWVFWRAADTQTLIKVLTKIVERMKSNCNLYTDEDGSAKEWVHIYLNDSLNHLTRMNADPQQYCKLPVCLNIAFAARSIDTAINYRPELLEHNKQLQDAIDTLKETQ